LGSYLEKRMSTVAEIEAAIARLPLKEARAVREWLEQWLEDPQGLGEFCKLPCPKEE